MLVTISKWIRSRNISS